MLYTTVSFLLGCLMLTSILSTRGEIVSRVVEQDAIECTTILNAANQAVSETSTTPVESHEYSTTILPAPVNEIAVEVRRKRSFLLRRCDVIKVTQCITKNPAEYAGRYRRQSQLAAVLRVKRGCQDSIEYDFSGLPDSTVCEQPPTEKPQQEHQNECASVGGSANRCQTVARVICN